MEVVLIVRLVMVPRVGVEPTRPYGQRILSPLEAASPSLTKRYEPVFTRLAVVKVSLRLVMLISSAFSRLILINASPVLRRFELKVKVENLNAADCVRL